MEEEGLDFDTMYWPQAQQIGLAEADPKSDVEGLRRAV